MKADKEYIIKIRRELHQIPEIGFDLPKTLKVVKRELDLMNIPYTDKYGKSSLVATINAPNAKKTVAIRADMDALPIEEKTGLPFSSLHKGQMHACGHDCHTAMLLGTAKMLKESEQKLPCNVRLIFQAGEEVAPGGAKLMCEDGVCEGVDAIIGTHVNAGLDVGKIALNKQCLYASSHGFFIDVYGKSCHVCSPQKGVDAIAVACRIYDGIQHLKSRELNPLKPTVIGIGEFHGGFANNVVCDHVHMHGTIRTTDEETDNYIYRRICEISEHIASDAHAKCEVKTTKHYPVLINNGEIADKIIKSGIDILGKSNVYTDKQTTMAGEDFAFYLKETKGCYFSLGVGVDNNPPAPAHSSNFYVDENGLEFAPLVFYNFVMNFK